MRLRSATALLWLTAAPLFTQGRTIDEGTFSVTEAGAARTENFKIMRGDNGLITATGQLLARGQQVTSSLTTDSLGSPIKYDIAVSDNGTQTLRVSVAAFAGRLRAVSYNQRGDESMREFALGTGRSRILDTVLVHQLYFVALSKRPGPIDLIEPRASHTGHSMLVAKGLEPISIGGRSLTATHYSLGNGPGQREFWVDADGRLLRVEIPSRQLVASRDDPPK